MLWYKPAQAVVQVSATNTPQKIGGKHQNSVTENAVFKYFKCEKIIPF